MVDASMATWAALEDKQPFVRLAEEDRARYAREMEEYTPSAAFLAELAYAKTDPKHGGAEAGAIARRGRLRRRADAQLTVEITVPQGLRAGEWLQVQAPDGRRVKAQVPLGTGGGDRLRLRLPARAAAAGSGEERARPQAEATQASTQAQANALALGRDSEEVDAARKKINKPKTARMRKTPVGGQISKDDLLPSGTSTSTSTGSPEEAKGAAAEAEAESDDSGAGEAVEEEARRTVRHRSVFVTRELDQECGALCRVEHNGQWLQYSVPFGLDVGARFRVQLPASSDASAVEGAQTLSFACPEGVSAGEAVTVTAPGGREVEVVVPEGVSAGEALEVTVEAAAEQEQEQGESREQGGVRRQEPEEEAVLTRGTALAHAVGAPLRVAVGRELRLTVTKGSLETLLISVSDSDRGGAARTSCGALPGGRQPGSAPPRTSWALGESQFGVRVALRSP